jgi:hypothetical protein
LASFCLWWPKEPNCWAITSFNLKQSHKWYPAETLASLQPWVMLHIPFMSWCKDYSSLFNIFWAFFTKLPLIFCDFCIKISHVFQLSDSSVLLQDPNILDALELCLGNHQSYHFLLFT